MERLRNSATLDDHGFVFDIDENDVIVNRYAPCLVFPDARYSVGVTRSSGQVKITAMRNPWREFDSLPLGEIFKKFGGGGHQRVGALILPQDRAQDAKQVLNQLLQELHKKDAAAEAVTIMHK